MNNEYNTMVDFSMSQRAKQPRKGSTVTAKTYNKAGFLGLGLKRGSSIRFKSTGNSKQDAVKLAKKFYNREKKAGRM